MTCAWCKDVIENQWVTVGKHTLHRLCAAKLWPEDYGAELNRTKKAHRCTYKSEGNRCVLALGHLPHDKHQMMPDYRSTHQNPCRLNEWCTEPDGHSTLCVVQASWGMARVKEDKMKRSVASHDPGCLLPPDHEGVCRAVYVCKRCNQEISSATYVQVKDDVGVFYMHDTCAVKAGKVPTEWVDHPAHYGGADNVYEHIKVADAWGLNYRLGNATKYIARAGKKTDNPLEDLKKARWYLDSEIQRLERK